MKEFFALPVEEKQKYARDPADLEGYATDPILSDEQVIDWSKRLFLNLLPLDSRKLKLWPETPRRIQIMSNGIFKSPLHRVTANARNERISVAVFYLPDTTTEIEPDERLITEERPQMYRKLKNYAAINFECFQSGKIALDTVRL
ncbi:hypothetical protein NL676_036210 [Syzygium grande]|nr:hypothetical protein NL676_036210 [Syzygium grande]